MVKDTMTDKEAMEYLIEQVSEAVASKIKAEFKFDGNRAIDQVLIAAGMKRRNWLRDLFFTSVGVTITSIIWALCDVFI